MSRTVPVTAALSLPLQGPEGPAYKSLQASLKRYGLSDSVIPENFQFWSEDFFHWPQLGYYQELAEPLRQQLVERCSQELLTEALAIEQSGLAYCAKMTLLAQSTDERLLYSLFAADEARHFEMLRPFVKDSQALGADPFLGSLTEIIETQPREVLQFIVQVVLEGWGLSHYKELARSSRSEALAASLMVIVQDEGRHHGSGLQWIQSQALSAEHRAVVCETLKDFLAMVQCGPQRQVRALSECLGGLSREQRRRVFGDLDCQAHSHERLQCLRALIASSGERQIVETLDSWGCFRAWTAEECG